MFKDIAYGAAMVAAEHKSEFKLTTDTSYLALTGELWGVCCKDIGENWPRCNGTAMYLDIFRNSSIVITGTIYVSVIASSHQFKHCAMGLLSRRQN